MRYCSTRSVTFTRASLSAFEISFRAFSGTSSSSIPVDRPFNPIAVMASRLISSRNSRALAGPLFRAIASRIAPFPKAIAFASIVPALRTPFSITTNASWVQLIGEQSQRFQMFDRNSTVRSFGRTREKSCLPSQVLLPIAVGARRRGIGIRSFERR